MKHELPALPYAQDALEPKMSAQTLSFHHGKHHAAYVNNLNNLLSDSPMMDYSLERLIQEAEGPVFNNAAQIWNHTFFFAQFSPQPSKAPSAALQAAIEKAWGSVEAFKEAFNKAAAGLFGSGWVWLAADETGALQIVSEPNAGNPLRKGLMPILTIDVWEHAYYLDYQNRRADYIAAFWDILDWAVVDARLL